MKISLLFHIGVEVSLLGEVLKRLTDAGLSVNRDKCEFLRAELRYLGFIVDESGLLVDPNKVEAILNIPVPNGVMAVRRYVGLASWYRRFIPTFLV